MPEDRLRKDYDVVENLSDLIKAREERDSASADDVDAMEDMDVDALPTDAQAELTYPHKHGPSEEERLGTDVELMDTPNEEQIEFDWQDSVEEMLPTDPHPSEGMGEDEIVGSMGHVDPNDLAGPVPSVEPSPETDTAATEEERIEYGLDGGETESPPVIPTPMDSAMDTDSDDYDFTIEDKFAGEVEAEVAELEMEEIRQKIEETEGEGRIDEPSG